MDTFVKMFKMMRPAADMGNERFPEDTQYAMAHFGHAETALLTAIRAHEIAVGISPDEPESAGKKLQNERLRKFMKSTEPLLPDELATDTSPPSLGLAAAPSSLSETLESLPMQSLSGLHASKAAPGAT